MQRVLLCGKSLLISGLQAILVAEPGLELQIVDPLPERIQERISAWEPDVMILETEMLQGYFSLALLQKLPAMKLIALDIEDNRLLVYSGSTSYQPTTEQLLRMIEQ